jgi:hypothetical protein
VAWAVNQLYWSDRALFDALAQALAHVAAAQRGGLAGGGGPELRDAMRVRSERLQQAVRAAERRLVESGSQGGLGVQQRLAATLEALASPRPSGAGASDVPGRLTAELAPHGFELAFGLGDMDLPPTPAEGPRGQEGPEGSGGPGEPGGSGGDEVPPAGVLEGAEPPRLKERKDTLGSRGAPPRETDSRRPGFEQQLAEAESTVGRLRRELEIAARTLREAESRTEAARNDLESLEARIPPTRARLEEKRAAENAARSAHEAVRSRLADAEHALESLEKRAD